MPPTTSQAFNWRVEQGCESLAAPYANPDHQAVQSLVAHQLDLCGTTRPRGGAIAIPE